MIINYYYYITGMFYISSLYISIIYVFHVENLFHILLNIHYEIGSLFYLL